MKAVEFKSSQVDELGRCPPPFTFGRRHGKYFHSRTLSPSHQEWVQGGFACHAGRPLWLSLCPPLYLGVGMPARILLYAMCRLLGKSQCLYICWLLSRSQALLSPYPNQQKPFFVGFSQGSLLVPVTDTRRLHLTVNSHSRSLWVSSCILHSCRQGEVQRPGLPLGPVSR